MDRWKIISPSLHMDWNRHVNRELKSPSFAELIFHRSASEANIRSHLIISLWKVSCCVDFKNLFWLMCDVQSTYYLTQHVAVNGTNPNVLAEFSVYLSQKAHPPAQCYPCI